MTDQELRVAAMTAANQAVSTTRYGAGYSMNGLPSAQPSQVLDEAKRIYAWFTEPPKKPTVRKAPFQETHNRR